MGTKYAPRASTWPRTAHTTVPKDRRATKGKLFPAQQEIADEAAHRAELRARGEAYEHTDKFGVVTRWSHETSAEIEARLADADKRRGMTTGAFSHGSGMVRRGGW